MSDMFEIKAIEMINRYLETAVNEPGNADARNGMAVAQYIAGMHSRMLASVWFMAWLTLLVQYSTYLMA